MTGMYGALPEAEIEFYDPKSVFRKGDPAPSLSLYKFVGKDGSPNRLMEKYTPQIALKIVTKQHARIADWIRAQEWGDSVPGGCWKYIIVSRRMKSCRNQLADMVKEIEEQHDRY